MAVLPTNNLTLGDWAKRIDPQGKVAVVANLLEQNNEMLLDAVFREGNLPTGHQETIQTGLPTVYWRQLNEGIQASKGQTSQITEAVGMLEARSEVDIDLISLNGEENAFRLSEAEMFIEAMSQEAATTILYGNPATDPNKILGLAPRYSSLSAGNAQNIIDAGGTTTNNTSIWLITWGDKATFLPFPKGSQIGIIHQDLGQQTIFKNSVNAPVLQGEPLTRMEALVDRYQFKFGLMVKDWRYNVRIANLDVDDYQNLTNNAVPTSVDGVIHMMVLALSKLPKKSAGMKRVWYMNRTMHAALMRIAMDKSVAALALHTGMNQFGDADQWMTFGGLMIRQMDALLLTEDRIT